MAEVADAALRLDRRLAISQPDPSSSGITTVRRLEAWGPRARSTPLVAGVLPRHFGFWASVMAPFSGEIVNGGLSLMTAPSLAVAGHSGVLVFEGSWIDTDQSQFADVISPDALIRLASPPEAAFKASAISRRIAGKHFLGFNPGWTNYAHWMTDHLPAVVYFRDHLRDEGFKLVLPSAKESHFSMQAVRLLGVADWDICFIENEMVEFEHLVFLSYIGFDSLPDATPAALARLKASVAVDPAAAKARIFVSRPDSGSRRLLNEDAVFDRLQALGFVRIAPGLMTVEEQIRTFDQAAVVVGPHGAGLMNAGFCRPGAALLELFSEYTLQPHFWNIASLGGLRYGFVSGTSFDQDVALWDPNGSWDAPFVLDPEAVAHAVRLFDR